MAVIVWQLELHKVCPRHVTTAGHIILTQSVTYTAKTHYLHTVCVSYTSYITKTHCFHTIPLWKKIIENYYKYHFNQGNSPISPQSEFQELATSQYFMLLSIPHPRILMAWPPNACPVVCLYTPEKTIRKLSFLIQNNLIKTKCLLYLFLHVFL